MQFHQEFQLQRGLWRGLHRGLQGGVEPTANRPRSVFADSLRLVEVWREVGSGPRPRRVPTPAQAGLLGPLEGRKAQGNLNQDLVGRTVGPVTLEVFERDSGDHQTQHRDEVS